MGHPRADEIVAAVRACVGTRFRPQGRLPGVGLDCAGLALVAAQAARFSIEAPRNYCLRSSNLVALIGKALRDARCTRLPAGEQQAGDLLWLETAPGLPHLAVVTGVHAVHAHLGVGRVIEAPLDPKWAVMSTFRFLVEE